MIRASIVIVTLALVIAISGCSQPLVPDTLVGLTDTQVQSQIGPPSTQFNGHYGAPPLTWTQQFAGPIKTQVFEQPDGEIYVSFEQRGTNWIAIVASLLPEGFV